MKNLFSILTFTYSTSSPTAKATFPGRVHGVVVQAKTKVPGSSTSSNFAVSDKSAISLYP